MPLPYLAAQEERTRHHQLARYDERIGRAVHQLERQVRDGDLPSAAEPEAEACRFDCGLAMDAAGRAAGDLREPWVEGRLYAEASLGGDYDLVHERVDALYGAVIAADVPLREAPLVIAYLDDPEEVPAERQRAIVYLAVEG